MNIPLLCAWNGCESNFCGDMPVEWRWLITYWSPTPIAVLDFLHLQCVLERDAVLCPVHAGELEALLKKIR